MHKAIAVVLLGSGLVALTGNMAESGPAGSELTRAGWTGYVAPVTPDDWNERLVVRSVGDEVGWMAVWIDYPVATAFQWSDEAIGPGVPSPVRWDRSSSARIDDEGAARGGGGHGGAGDDCPTGARSLSECPVLDTVWVSGSGSGSNIFGRYLYRSVGFDARTTFTTTIDSGDPVTLLGQTEGVTQTVLLETPTGAAPGPVAMESTFTVDQPFIALTMSKKAFLVEGWELVAPDGQVYDVPTCGDFLSPSDATGTWTVRVWGTLGDARAFGYAALGLLLGAGADEWIEPSCFPMAAIGHTVPG